MSEESPMRTVLHPEHVELGARLVDFHGWEMPVLYSGTIEEHMAVREKAGLFDVSHMGQMWVEGPGAEATLSHLTTADASRLKIGRMKYEQVAGLATYRPLVTFAWRDKVSYTPWPGAYFHELREIGLK